MNGTFDHGWARGVSLVAALGLMILVTLLPRALTHTDGSTINHGVLVLVMWGMSAGFVHGVGFVPLNRVLRVVLGPWVAWPLLALGLFLFARHLSA